MKNQHDPTFPLVSAALLLTALSVTALVFADGSAVYSRTFGVGPAQLAADSFLSAPLEVAQAYGMIPYYDTPSFSDYSDLDMERRREKRLRELDGRSAQARMRARSDARLQSTLDSRSDYQPPPPEQDFLTSTGPGGMTVDQAARSVQAQNQMAAAQPVQYDPSLASKTMIGLGDAIFYYENGIFYTKNGDEYIECASPVGAVVYDIPADAAQVKAGGSTYFKVNDTYFLRVLYGGEVFYKVSEPPAA